MDAVFKELYLKLWRLHVLEHLRTWNTPRTFIRNQGL